MSRAIEDLLHEHQAIVFALKILANINHKLESSEPVEPADLSAFVGFLREFADKCHHGKEEGLLFPAMAAAGAQETEGLLGRLLKEHEEGRRWMTEMASAIIPSVNASAFVRAAQGYTELLRAHIERENSVLFPMAERILSAERLDALYDAFENHESQVIGQGRHEELHALLQSLKSKYAAS